MSSISKDLIIKAILKDWSFDHSTINCIDRNNYSAVTVNDRYGVVTIEILPERKIYIDNKVHNYNSISDITRIFKTG